MADTDDKDWQDFMASTELDDDDVETLQEEDENLNDEGEGDEEDESKKKSETEKGKKADDEEEGDDPDKAKKPKKTDPPKADPADKGDAYTPRLTQFLNDKGELDTKKIEEAYIASSKEGVRLNDELKESRDQMKQLLAAIAKDPEVAKKLLGEESAKKIAADVQAQPENKDPIMADYEAKMVKASKAEYDEFVDNHPESVSDPEKASKISSFLKFYGPWYQKENNGEIASMKDSLEAAYRHYGWDLEIDKKESVAIAAKKTAATRSTPQSKKPASKNGLTKEESFFAKKLGVKL